MRKIAARKKPERRFKGTEDAAHLERVRAMPCLLRGKRCTQTVWRRPPGGSPFKMPVQQEFIHVCDWSPKRDPHHTKTKGTGGHDHTAVPLCFTAHREWHDLGSNKAFLDKWGVDLVAFASQLAPTPEQDGKE
jgi:hypothetical protein